APRTALIAVSGRIDRLDDRLPGPARPGGAGPARAEPEAGEPEAGGPEDGDWDEDGPAAGGEPGGLVVVDYKTGRHLLTVDDARSSLPLALYALAAERAMRRPCHRGELHPLPAGRVLAWEHSPQSLARQLARAEDIAGECAVADERYREPGGDRGDATF